MTLVTISLTAGRAFRVAFLILRLALVAAIRRETVTFAIGEDAAE